jgi:NADPH-dependent ferric siderophore reductase
VKLFFPAPGDHRPLFPEGGPARDYTPRRHDPVTRELTLEFVLHGDGPAAAWAAQAAPGQWLGVGGPRGSLLVPETYDVWLLAGDETALPSIARRLEEMRPGARAIALIEVENAAEERHLPTAANAAITWLHRNGAPPGTTRLLDQALEALSLPSGDLHAWLAGEIDTARRLRTHLIDTRGIARADIKAAGYWRLGAAAAHGRIED